MDDNFYKNINPKSADKINTFYAMHTMSLCARLTANDMKITKEKLIQYSSKCEKGYYTNDGVSGGKWKYYKFTVAREFGFNEIALKRNVTGEMIYYWMLIKINPRWMFHPEDHPFTYIADKEEVIEAFGAVQNFLNITGITVISNEAFYIQRIDYCVNIDLGSADATGEYMRLMKKGAYPRKAKRLMKYSKSGKRMIPVENSFTVYTDYYEFSIYDKQYQLKDEYEKYEEEEIREALGTIRIEYRAGRGKIRNEVKKNECTSNKDFLLLTPEIAEKNIKRYLTRIYGTGRFVKVKEAKWLIECSNYRKKTKEVMKEILRVTSKTSLQEVKLRLEDDFPKYMKKFNELGISPITLKKTSLYDTMENPLFYIEKRNRNFGLQNQEECATLSV